MPVECEYSDNPAALASSAPQQYFLRAEWFADMAKYCLPGRRLCIATASGDGGRITLPLVAHDRTLRSLANWYSFIWQPIIDGAGREYLAALARDLRRHGHSLTLESIPATDGMAEWVADGFRAGGWRVTCHSANQNHWLDTKGRSFDDWWAARPGALRSTVQRKAKKGLVDLTIETQFSDALWDEYETVYQASWKPAEGQPPFLRARARADAAAGELRLGIARIDGIAVAAQYWTVADHTAYIHKLAHVSGQDALSPGTLLTHALFRHAFDVDKVARIDFGTGDDGYKRDWMEDCAPLINIRAWDVTQPAAWPGAARDILSPLAAMLRRS